MNTKAILFVAVSILIGTVEGSAAQQRKSLTHPPAPAGDTEAWLGVSVQDMTTSIARSLETNTERGAFVTEVFEDSPAERAGLREEDIVVRFDEEEISDADDLARAVRRSSPGTSCSIEVVRGNEHRTFRTELERRERRVRMHSFHMPPIPRWSGNSVAGMHVITLSDQLAAYFSIPDRHGVLVTEVEETSPAQKAGIVAGDVITQAGGTQIDDTGDLDEALSSRDTGEAIDLTVYRKGTAKTVSLTPGKRKRSYFHFGPNSFFFDREGEGLFDADGWEKWEDDLREGLEQLDRNLRLSLPHFHRRV
jgi:C-terminal processing protease CtpA/Prc